MSKEEKMLYLVTLLPLVRDVAEDIREDFPYIVKQGLKKAVNELIRQFDLIGDEVMATATSVDRDEMIEQYQLLYEVHLQNMNNTFTKDESEAKEV